MRYTESIAEVKRLRLTGRATYFTNLIHVPCWFLNGELHRTNGPAFGKWHWFVNGNDITDDVRIWRQKNNIKKLSLTKQQETEFKLKFL